MRYRYQTSAKTITTTSPMITSCSNWIRRPSTVKMTTGKASKGKRRIAVLDTFCAIASSTRSAPMDDTMAENSGALRRRSGRNATMSSTTEIRPPASMPTSSAT
ncbi:hypothetical protein D9M72_647270 [compost metagenome]